MTKSINIKNIIKLIASVALIVYLCFNIKLEKLQTLDINVIFYIFVAVIINLTALIIMSFRWHILVEEYLHKSIHIIKLFGYYLVGSFFNIFMPGAVGGDIIRVQKLATRHNLGIKGPTIIAIVERFAGLYGLCLLFSVSVACGNYPNGFNIGKFINSWLLELTPFLVLLFIPLLKYILKYYKLDTSYAFIIKTIAVLLLSQMGDIIIAYLFSSYFNLDISFSAFFFIMPLVYIATVLPISLGGLGVREGTFAGLMLLYGIDSSIAIIISFLMYITKVIVGIIGYIVYIKEK